MYTAASGFGFDSPMEKLAVFLMRIMGLHALDARLLDMAGNETRARA